MHCVFIHGPVASGKLTIATELQAISGLPLHHNHLAVDAALSLFPFGSDEFVRVRQEIWLTIFREASAAAQSFIFTFAPESSVPPSLIGSLIEAVEANRGRVFFIALTCPEPEIERRVEDSNRARHRKLNSLAFYRQLRKSGAFHFPEMPPPLLSVATDMLTPEKAAAEIHAAVIAAISAG